MIRVCVTRLCRATDQAKGPGQSTRGLGSLRPRSVLGHDRDLALAPAEAPVDAEFDDVDVLGDVSIEDPTAHRRNREGDVAAPEAVEVVLEEGRPVGGKR